MSDDQTYTDVLNFLIPNFGVVKSLDDALKLYAAALEQSHDDDEAAQ